MITIQDALEILENCPIKSGIVYIPFEVKNAVAEVLRRVVSGELVEVVHAHWIEMDDDCSNLWKCSHCGLVWEMSNDDTPQENEMFQCPKCGALMGKGDSHEAD
ncbi:MAG: hypothetical protein M0R51_11845 [Clostridia bacterium]|jgi:rubrerythrin|nr:hypothetical protein [Clostridia bacterium]